MNLREIYRDLRRKTDPHRVYRVLKEITSYHRIQGSEDLWNAVRRLREELSQAGVESRIQEAPLDSSKGFVETPVGWDPVYAELKIWVERDLVLDLDLKNHPTLLTAHVGSGEGCSELSLCYGDSCEREAVITDLLPYEAYEKYSARLILHYNPSRHPEAVPYTSLFIRSQDIKRDKVIMNIPYSKASRIVNDLAKNKSVKVCWKSETRYRTTGSLPILHTCTGDEEIMFISHICHPLPGAHDNASGSTANYLIAYLRDKSEYTRDLRYCNVWVPEYTGTVYLDKVLGGSIEYVVNLDMIGSRQEETGSVLTIVNPPIYSSTRIASAQFIALKTSLDLVSSFNNTLTPSIRYDVTPYSTGSDHDLAVMWGLDTVMLNEWPSKYYHTDMDSIDTISIENLINTAISSLIAGYIVSSRELSKRAEEIYRDYLRTWYAAKALIQGVDVSGLSGFLRAEKRISVPRDLSRTPIHSRYIYRVLGGELYSKIRRINLALTYLEVYAALSEISGLKNHIEIFQIEELIRWSEEERSLVSDAWEILRSHLKL
ncbi:MAG: M28 family peptidase [Sulfolobales archaeon]